MVRLLLSKVFLVLVLLFPLFAWSQCPTFTAGTTITAGCSGTGCSICPGTQLTIQTTGTGLPTGGCVDFYYSTNPAFNPNLGQGTFMGCGTVPGTTPTPCTTCPTVLLTMVQGCNVPDPVNEFLGIWSGSGFTAGDLNVNFSSQNSSGGGQNSSIGSGCSWATPTAALMSALQSTCSGGTIIAAGPSTVIPPNALVMAFTSRDANYPYDLSTACLVPNLTIYVMQSACTRTGGAFSNASAATATTPRTHSISLAGCSSCVSSVTYTPSTLSGSQGDVLASVPFLPPVPGNIPCGSPLFPGLPPVPAPTPQTVSINWTVPASLCNGGPYYVSAIPNPLSASCPQVQATPPATFNVVCPTPVLTPPPPICDFTIPFNLNTILNMPYTGTWTSLTHPTRVTSGGSLNLSGATGPIAVTFTPTPCGSPTSAIITLGNPPIATINPVSPVCEGSNVLLTIGLSGTGPFMFDVYQNGSLLNSYSTSSSSQVISVTPTAPSSTYEVRNLTNGGCAGADKSRTITVIPAPTANLTLSGPATVCAGAASSLQITFPQGTAPWSYTYTVNGSNPQSGTATAGQNPTTITVNPTVNSTYALTSVSSSGCGGTATGMATVNVSTAPTATVQASTTSTVCQGLTVLVPVSFSGTGPWTFTYNNNGSPINSVTTLNNPYNITITPSAGANQINLSSLTTNNGVCAGTYSGNYNVTALQAPTADLYALSTICSGASANLEVTFTGTGPFNFGYVSSLGGGTQTATATSNPYTLPVSPAASATYSLVSVSSSGCTGTTTGSGSVTVNTPPEAQLTTGSASVCAGQSTNIPVTFTGTGPFTFQYTIDNIAQAIQSASSSPFMLPVTVGTGSHVIELLSVRDGAGCLGNVLGNYTITGTSAPSGTLAGSTTLCGGGNASLTLNFTGTAPFSYVLAINGTNQPVATANSTMATLTFPHSTTTTYNLVSVTSGTCTGTGSGSATVSVQPGASANFVSGSSSICSNDALNLPVNLTGGGPYTLTYSLNGSNQTQAVSANTTSLNFPSLPLGNNTINLVSVTNGGSCTGGVSGTYNVNVAPNPTGNLTGTATLCGGGNSPITLNFTGTAPFEYILAIDGVHQPMATTSNTNQVLNFPHTKTTTYELILVNSVSCSGTAAGMATVTVQPGASANFASDTVAFCSGQAVTIPVNLVGSGPYNLTYSLNGTNQTQNGIAGPSTTLSFPNLPAGANTINLVSVSNGGSCTGGVSGTYLANVTTTPSGVLSGDATLCGGGNSNLTINFTGTAPFNYIMRVNGSNQASATTSSNPLILTLPHSTTTNYALVSVSSGVCTATATGTATVTVQSGASASFTPVQDTLCKNENILIPVTLTGGGPYDLYYSVNGLSQVLANIAGNSQTLDIQNLATGSNQIKLDSVTNGGCTGGVSGLYSAFVQGEPVATISGNRALCTPGNANLTVSFTGIAPYTLNYQTNGANPQNIQNIQSSPYTLTVNAATSSTYTLVDCTANGCLGIGQGQGQVTFGQSLTGEISGTQPYCQNSGLGADLTVDFVGGTAPYTFVYTENGVIQPSIVTSDNPHVFMVYPLVGTTYELALVSTADCGPGTVSGSAVISVFTPPTAAIASQGGNQCGAGSATVEVDFTGTGPFTLTYSLNGVNQTPITTNDDPYFLNLNLTANTNVALKKIESIGCTGQVPSDSISFKVIQNLLFSNFNLTCDQANGTYTVKGSISGGTSPYSIIQGSGTVLGTNFTSIDMALTDPYAIWITDASGCDTIKLTGVSNCSCITDAGTMNQDTIDACVSAAAVLATFNQDSTLDADDVFYFILHTAPGAALGNVIARSNTPSFPFLPGSMFPEIPYYISAIAGNPTTMGQVDINDPCHSIAAGTTVIWHEEPTAFLDGNFNICKQQSQPLTFYFTGVAPFSFSYLNNGTTVLGTAVNNTWPVNTMLQNDATFSMVSVQDANCPGLATGKATINVHPEPEIANVTVSCDAPSQTYIVEFDVNHDSLSSVTITGSINGAYDTLTGHFISAPVPWGMPYKARVADLVWLCGIDSIQGMPNCNCATFAGAMSQTPMSFCAEEKAIVPVATGSFLEPNDSLTYYLTTAQGPSTWTILGVNDVPEFDFNAGLITVGQTYYIIAVAGDTTSSQPGGVNGGDPCRSVSLGTPISWRAPVTAFLSGNTQICQGDTATLKIVFKGKAPFTFNYLNNSLPQPVIQSPTDTFYLKVYPTLSANYSPISVVDNGGCVGTVSGGGAVSVLLPPNLIQVKQICDFVNGTYQVSFKISNGAAPNPVYTVQGLAGTLSDTTFLSNPITSTTPFSLMVTTPVGCTASLSGMSQCACTTSAGNIQTGPLSLCSAETLIFTHDGDYVLDSNDILRYILFENPSTLPLGILMENGQPTFDFNPNTMTIGQTYYIAAVAGNPGTNGNISLTDPCLDFSDPTEVVFNAGPTANLMGTISVCAGADTSVTAQFTGTPPFLFSYRINGSNPITLPSFTNSFTFSFMDVLQSQTVTLLSISDANCMGTAMGTATITVEQGPKAVLTGPAQICPGEMATLALTLSGGQTYDVEISDGTNPPILLTGIMNGHTFDVIPTQNTTYTVTALSSPTLTCPGQTGSEHSIVVADMTVTANAQQYGSYQISCFGESDGQIEWVPMGGLGGYTFEWSSGQTGSSQSGLEAGQYDVTVTDQSGCIGMGSTQLDEPNPIVLDWSATTPDCLGQDIGSIKIEDIFGGDAPFSYTISPTAQAASTNIPILWNDLTPGRYTIMATDANGCVGSDTITIIEPNSLQVDLGGDLTLKFGDSTNIEALVSQDHLSYINWQYPGTVAYPDSMFLHIRPYQTTAVIVTVGDSLGCEATDRIVIGVEQNIRVYIPDIFHGDGNGVSDGNHIFTVYGGPEVEEIELFQIYDRWGEQVYANENFEPNSTTVGWDGQFKGKRAAPGVYVYQARIRFIDGTTYLAAGDVTLIR